MGVVEGFLNLLLIFLVVRSLFTLFALRQAKKTAEKIGQENPPLETKVKEEIELVTDSICGRTLPKTEAFILARDNNKHYFCSWDCREKFINGDQM